MSDNLAADKDWKEAELRAKMHIELSEQRTECYVAWAMRQLDASRTTVFRLAKQYREDARTSAHLLNTSGPKPVMQPLDLAVETVVSRLMRNFYATRGKPTKTRFWREVAAICHARGLTRFYRRILAAIGAPEPPRATLSVLESLARRLLTELHPKMLVIDESDSLSVGNGLEASATTA